MHLDPIEVNSTWLYTAADRACDALARYFGAAEPDVPAARAAVRAFVVDLRECGAPPDKVLAATRRLLEPFHLSTTTRRARAEEVVRWCLEDCNTHAAP